MSTGINTLATYPITEFRGNRKYAMSSIQLTSVLSFLNTPNLMQSLISSATHLFEKPTDYISSIRAYPFNLTEVVASSTAVSEIKVGPGITLTNVTGTRLDLPLRAKLISTYTLSRYFNNFLDFNPYTKITAWLPYCGYIDLNANEVMGKQLKFYYSFDLDTGKCVAYIEASGTVIASKSGVCGVDLPLGETNAREVANNIVLSGLNTAVGALTNVASGGSSVVGLHGGLVKSILQQAQTNQVKGSTEAGGGGAYTMLAAPQSIYLIIQRPKVVNVTNYNELYGKPCGQSYLLSTLTGFTKVDSVHLTGFNMATDQEVAEIERLMKEGIHL